jgi:pyridoxal phosphate enzyme (YggS family)
VQQFLKIAKIAQMSSIAENILNITTQLGEKTTLLVVSKYRKPEEIMEAYEAGQRKFAENRVQALLERYEALPKDIEWHLIGHLQTNKVKYIVPFVSLIHSADSLKLLQETDRQAAKINKIQDVLLQVFIASEETKFGLDPDEVLSLVESDEFRQLKNIRVCGLMAMASNTDNEEQIRSEFDCVKQLFDRLKSGHFQQNPEFCELSIGMSSDYSIAKEYGSTMVRIGSRVFED